MRFIPLAIGTMLLTSSAFAQAPSDGPRLGRPVEGVTVTLTPSGELRVLVGEVITLEDGRELRRVEGSHYRLFAEDEAAAAPREIGGLDFLLHAAALNGSRVKVIGGTFLGANARSAQLALQGGTVWVRFAGAAVDAVRDVVQNCAGFSRNEAACGYTVTGTVRTREAMEPELIEPVLEPRRSPGASLRR